MAKLVLEPNIREPDEFYAELLAAHEGLSKSESDAFNARLILLLANHVGDREVLREAFAAAALAPSPLAGEGGRRPDEGPLRD